MLSALGDRIAATPFADWAASAPFAYPVANTIHVLGLVVLLGGIGIVDLRLLGAFRRLPLQPLAQSLVPVAAVGVLVMGLSGSVLFAADAEALARSGVFRTKLVLIALALANVAAFRLAFGATVADPPPAMARLLGLVSLLAWTSVAIAGRWIAYG